MSYRDGKIADRLGVCTKTIERAIKKKAGIIFLKYQTGRRLEIAVQQLLAEPDIRPSQMASAYGFYEAFRFSRLLKAKFGVSPTKYKTENRYVNGVFCFGRVDSEITDAFFRE